MTLKVTQVLGVHKGNVTSVSTDLFRFVFFFCLYNYYNVCNRYRACYLFFLDLDCDYVHEPFLSFFCCCLLMIPTRIFWLYDDVTFPDEILQSSIIGAYDIRKGEHLIVLHLFGHGTLILLLYPSDHHYLIILYNFKTTKEYWGCPPIQITQGIPFWWN